MFGLVVLFVPFESQTSPAPPPSLVVTHVRRITDWFEELIPRGPAGGAGK